MTRCLEGAEWHAAYRAWGRPAAARWQREHWDPPGKPGYAITATGVSHCGAGCTLGDIMAEFAVFGLGASVAGLLGWMAILYFVLFPAPHHLHPGSPVYWFLMQAGMIAGFFTAWPVNAWLLDYRVELVGYPYQKGSTLMPCPSDPGNDGLRPRLMVAGLVSSERERRGTDGFA